MSSLKRKDPPTASLADGKKPKKNGDLTSFFGPPKVKPAANANSGSSPLTGPSTTNGVDDSVSVKFDKDKWVAGLTEERRKLLQLEIDTLDPSWLAVLKEEVTTPGFLDLKRFLQKEIDSKQTIYPPLEDVYSWYVLRGFPCVWMLYRATSKRPLFPPSSISRDVTEEICRLTVPGLVTAPSPKSAS
jgi:uracil-DNA glycosylase